MKLTTYNPSVLFYRLQPDKIVDDLERKGVTKIYRRIKRTFKRAKRGNTAGDQALYKFMIGTRNMNSHLPLVTNLLKKAPEFKAGDWHEGSKYSGGRQPDIFKDLVRRVENQTPDFLWESWHG